MVTSNKSAKTGNAGEKILRWLLKGLLLAAILWIVFLLTGSVLRDIAIAQIAELTNTRIVAESVDFSLNGSIFIEKLVIRPDREPSRYDDSIFKAETVYARFSIASLLMLRPRLKNISVKDFVFNAQQDLDTGRWNLAEFKIEPPKGGSGKIPVIELEGGMLQYSKVSNGQVKVAAAVPLDMNLAPAENPRDGYNFSVITAKRDAFHRSTLEGSCKPGRITIVGGISSTDIPAFEKVWIIDVLAAELNYDRSNTYSLKLRIKDLTSKEKIVTDTFVLDNEIFFKKFGLFTALQKFFRRYQPRGHVDIDLEASGNMDRLRESKLVGKVYCRDVSICDRKFFYPVEHLVGQLDFTEKNVSLNSLQGRHGKVELTFNGWSKDFGPNRQYQIRITSDNMALDNDLYNALSTKQKKFWSSVSPSGLAAIDYRLVRKSQTDKTKTLKVELRNAEATYKHFPYPLKNLNGHLLFNRDGITFSNLVSQWDARKISIDGKVTSLGKGRPMYNISIRANNIPLDSTLAAAMPDRQKHLCSKFGASGSVYIGNLTGRFWSTDESEQPSYLLSLRTEQLELNDDLFKRLPTPVEKIVTELQLKGKVNINSDLTKAGNEDYPDYTITVECLDNSINFKSFPYPLKDIRGSLRITKDSIMLKDIIATAADNVQIAPNPSTVKVNGRITLDGDVFSSGEFAFCANDILFDERLAIALPEGIRAYYTRLSPTGRFDLDFNNIKIFNGADGGRYIDFNGATSLKICNFNTSPAITELDAVLKVKGSYKLGDWLRDGRIALVADSLRIKDKRLANLKADLYYDHNLRSWLTKNLIAHCYDGRLTGKFELKQPADNALEYLLQTGFDNIDLKKFLSDTQTGQTRHNGYTSGVMAGSLSVCGQIGKNNSRIGRCRLQITDMQVGKLSPLAKLLQVLQLTEPSDFAFEQMLVDSYIKHNRLFFEKFDLSGEALAFNGSGWMDLQNQDIRLTLTARGRRLATAEPSILQSLTESLGQAVVRMEVAGNFYDPQVTTKTLPVLGDSLRILGTRSGEPD